MSPWRHWGTLTDASALSVAHRYLSFAMLNNNDNGCWPVHSLMLSLHDLRSLPLRRLHSLLFRAVWFSTACHVGRHGRTMVIFGRYLRTNFSATTKIPQIVLMWQVSLQKSRPILEFGITVALRHRILAYFSVGLLATEMRLAPPLQSRAY